MFLELRQEILEKRYFLKDDSGRPVEDWDGLCWRVARALALEKSEEERFFDVLSNCLFLPNTPALANAGTGRSDMSFSACFVLPVGDSMAEIFGAVREAALIQKSGGGTGFSFSRIRPSGDVVGSTKGVASGPCSFIHVFDAATETIKQGSLRRGANMGILRVDHPDIMEFIGLKREEGRLSNFNLSVGITDRFMEALREDREFELVFGGRVRRTLRAREVWDRIVDSAWRNGEPGLVFLDVVNRFNPTPHLGDIEATNPCVTGDTLVATPSGYRRADTFRVGDEILTVCGVGKVGSIEVNHDVPVFEVEFSDGGSITVTASHQFYAFKSAEGGVPERCRPIMLRDLRIGDWVKVFPVGSTRSREGRARIESIRPVGTATVYDLFEPETDTWITNGYVSRGCGEQPLLPYEACVLGSVNLSKMVRDGNIDTVLLGETVRTGVRMLDNIIDVQGYPLPEIEAMHKGNRKIGLGVMGWADMLLKLGISYGSDRALELAGKVMSFITQVAVDESQRLAWIKGVFPNWEGSVWYVRGLKVRNATLTTVAPTGSISIIAGCSSGIEPVFDWVTVQKRPVGEHRVVHPVYESWQHAHPSEPLPSWFVTAREVPVEWHIRMQAAFQKHVHNAVSKTVNLPREATREDVSRAFLLAYELGCKGITVYRDGSRALQVISSPGVSSRPAGQVELPSVMEAKRVCVETSEGKVYVNISFHESIPREVFISTPVESKHSEVYESFARIFSVALRHGVPLRKLISQLEKANAKYGSVVSVPYALVRAFRLLGVNGEAKCPDCGSPLVLEEGCLKCHSCGFSRC